MAGFRLATRIFAAPEVRQVCGEAFVLTEAGRLGKYNNLSRRNAVLGWLGAKMFDASPRVGMRLLNTLARTRPLRDFVDDDDTLADFVRGSIIGTNHVSGTCRIGAVDDPMAVVDPAGAVYGVGGLRVADASAMPSVPSGNTHIPTVMVAEKIADAIRTGARQRARPGWQSAMQTRQGHLAKERNMSGARTTKALAPEELRKAIADHVLSFPLTDFDDQDQFDPASYRRRLEWLNGAGASGHFVVGGAGEFFSLTAASIAPWSALLSRPAKGACRSSPRPGSVRMSQRLRRRRPRRWVRTVCSYCHPT